ncbi:MAG: V-type ATPase subunit [Clostridia bacterium]|nr:V-type ATPase subunit [Clostridia bacterium]
MKDSFAFAAGGVRALENSLLTRAFFFTLADADEGERRRLLADRGFTGFEKSADPDEALSGRMEAVYEELLTYLPDGSILDFCLLPNDYHNLKVALKGLIRGGERKSLYRRPALYDPALLREPLSAKDWDALPPFLREDAREGYEILTQTGNGQQLDLELDRRCLLAVLEAGKKAGDLARAYTEKFVLYTDLRVALRLSRQTPGRR